MIRYTVAALLVTLAGFSPSLAASSPSQEEPMPLEETYWKLIDIGGEAALDTDREAHMILTAEEQRLNGSTGCNSFFAGYELDGDSLKLSAVGMTRMACLEAVAGQELAFAKMLEATRSFRIDGKTLELRKGEEVLARFEAQELDSDKSAP